MESGEVDWQKKRMFLLYYTHNDEWILCCALLIDTWI